MNLNPGAMTALGMTEVRCVLEMARSLQEISEGRVPKSVKMARPAFAKAAIFEPC